MFCRFCGAMLPDDAVFCRSCGHNLAKEQPQQVPVQPSVQAPVQLQMQPPVKRFSPVLLILIILTSLMTLFTAGYFVYDRMTGERGAVQDRVDPELEKEIG